jgi:hypothetical protein
LQSSNSITNHLLLPRLRTIAAAATMPSKGVHVFTYISVPGCSIELSVPGETAVRSELNEFWNGTFEVDSGRIEGTFNYTGAFRFRVLRDGNVVTDQWADVNALTGNCGDGTLTCIAETPSILHGDDLIVSYGFYAAGSGHDILPSRHQCYITVTPNFANWIGSVAPPGSEQENRSFRRLVLPAAHDVGMNSMTSVSLLLQHAGAAVVSKLLSGHETGVLQDVANTLSGPAVQAIAPDIVASLALTQKDPLSHILSVGARYFEFRPARCHSDVLSQMTGDGQLADVLYFQHSAIPGMAYAAFLADVVSFLAQHPTEIVVVQLRWDGVPGACERPSEEAADELLRNALGTANGELNAGGLDDLRNKTIGDLRREGKRLIMLRDVGSLSTYTDEGNATVDGDSIVAAFDSVLTPERCSENNFVNIQCQATATNVPKAVAYSVMAASASNSILLGTKGTVDHKTLPWVRDNLIRTCGEENLVVVMNDFLEGATVDVAVGLSRARLG